jgi:2-hydroxychromene-2-carboxylate isomerase
VGSPVVVFYFSAMSPYSWLAAERIGELLPQARWTPIAGAVIHAAAGRKSWGVTVERSRNVAECEARAHRRGLGRIVWPAAWPSDGTLAARALTWAGSQGPVRPMALASMRIGFLEGQDLSRVPVLSEAARRVGMDTRRLLTALESPEVERGLASTTQEAIAAGVRGMPTVLVDGEPFWGDDRLEDAARAAGSRAPSSVGSPRAP